MSVIGDNFTTVHTTTAVVQKVQVHVSPQEIRALVPNVHCTTAVVVCTVEKLSPDGDITRLLTIHITVTLSFAQVQFLLL